MTRGQGRIKSLGCNRQPLENEQPFSAVTGHFTYLAAKVFVEIIITIFNTLRQLLADSPQTTTGARPPGSRWGFSFTYHLIYCMGVKRGQLVRQWKHVCRQPKCGSIVEC